MTKDQAEQTAASLRNTGWPIVYIEVSDDSTWRAVAEDWAVRDGWLTRLKASHIRAGMAPVSFISISSKWIYVQRYA
jgi:hypothetical protein